MALYIYGTGKDGFYLLNRLPEKYGIEVCGFLDTYREGEIEGKTIYSLENVSAEDVIIISTQSHANTVEIYNLLKQHNLKNIYWHHSMNWRHSDELDFFADECTPCDNWGDCVVPHIEFHIVDNCNLNCAGCTHFSPLFTGTSESFEDKIKIIDLLNNKFTCIAGIDILGGEPLLSDRLGDYVVELRKRLPHTFINIFTNGLLIPKLDDDILEIIKENRVFFSITEYMPTHKMIDKISGKLEDNHIGYWTSGYNSREMFNCPITTSSNSIYPQRCISKGCYTVANGAIAKCPTLMYVSKFNEVFDEKLPTDGIYPLDGDMEGRQLLKELEKEVPLCKHCISYPINWYRVGNPPIFDDFAVRE